MLREQLERIDCAKGPCISGEPGVHSAHHKSPVHWSGMVSMCGLFSRQKATGILSLWFRPHLSEANLQTKSTFPLEVLGGGEKAAWTVPTWTWKLNESWCPKAGARPSQRGQLWFGSETRGETYTESLSSSYQPAKTSMSNSEGAPSVLRFEWESGLVKKLWTKFKDTVSSTIAHMARWPEGFGSPGCLPAQVTVNT